MKRGLTFPRYYRFAEEYFPSLKIRLLADLIHPHQAHSRPYCPLGYDPGYTCPLSCGGPGGAATYPTFGMLMAPPCLLMHGPKKC